MATENYATYEALQKSGKMFGSTVDFSRLRWCLKGSIAASISVVQDPYHPNAPYPLELYQDEKNNIHPISALPLTAPPCSSIEISLPLLDGYPLDWQHVHGHHADPGEEDVRFEKRQDSDDDDSPGSLVHCCGEDVPGPGPSLLVQAEKSGSYLTIGHFIAEVHPRLAALEGRIRTAKGVWEALPLEPRYSLFVRPAPIKSLRIVDNRSIRPTMEFEAIATAMAKFWPKWESEHAMQSLSLTE